MAQTYTLTKLNDEYTYSVVKVLRNGKWVEIGNNATINDGDTLKITFNKNPDNESWRTIQTALVNGLDFTSGGQMTVRSNVEVYVSSNAGVQTKVQALAPAKPYIGQIASLTVFEAMNHSMCSIRIEAGDVVKYLAPPFLDSDGDLFKTSDVVNLFQLGYGRNLVSFIMPEAIYSSMPIDKWKRIKITCTTYTDNGRYIVGTPHSEYFYVYADPDVAVPRITATVRDVNEATTALTGDDSILVRYVSRARCEIDARAWPANTTHIVEATVNNFFLYRNYDYSESAAQVTAHTILTGNNLTSNKFDFVAIDARSGTPAAKQTVETGWIPYIKPQLNTVEVARGGAGDNDTVYVNFYGYFYNGRFGASGAKNKIKLQYRYRADDSNTYSDWAEISQVGANDEINILVSGQNEYGVFKSASNGVAGALAISGTFNHSKSYAFQFRVCDGNGSDILSYSESKAASCPPSVPVFDWGKSDFNFNVPVKINNVNIFDIVYPIGSVYFCYSSAQPTDPPSSIAGIGTWTLIGAAMSNIYAWLRTE